MDQKMLWRAAPGAAFTILVVALLVVLHAQTPSVPRLGQWAEPPSVALCSDAPGWAGPLMDPAVNFWNEHGAGMSRLPVSRCHEWCDVVGENGLIRTVPCRPGTILITLRDQHFQDSHAAETLYAHDIGNNFAWATILLPSDLVPGLRPDMVSTMDIVVDADLLIIKHELGHAMGLEHVVTSLPWPLGFVTASPSGHVMARSVDRLGTGVAGLPQPLVVSP